MAITKQISRDETDSIYSDASWQRYRKSAESQAAILAAKIRFILYDPIDNCERSYNTEIDIVGTRWMPKYAVHVAIDLLQQILCKFEKYDLRFVSVLAADCEERIVEINIDTSSLYGNEGDGSELILNSPTIKIQFQVYDPSSDQDVDDVKEVGYGGNTLTPRDSTILALQILDEFRCQNPCHDLKSIYGSVKESGESVFRIEVHAKQSEIHR